MENFQDCGATVKFIETIDWLFDFLNTRNPFGKGYKQPLTSQRLTYLKPLLIKKINYLYTLKAKDGRLVVDTARRTFICGFASAVKSIIEIAEHIFREKHYYKYILTYRFSQDHIELLFAKIRSRHGHNNNPNVLQFRYAMRQILMRNSLKSTSQSTNCIEIDHDPVGLIYDIVWKKKKEENVLSYIDIEPENNNDQLLTTVKKAVSKNVEVLTENILYYIAGYMYSKKTAKNGLFKLL